MTKTPELLPCPWCGEKPKWLKSLTRWFLSCTSPGGEHDCAVVGDTLAEAVRRWNTRAPAGAVNVALVNPVRMPLPCVGAKKRRRKP